MRGVIKQKSLKLYAAERRRREAGFQGYGEQRRVSGGDGCLSGVQPRGRGDLGCWGFSKF